MRAAVTGPTGHLGANLVRALIADGHDVRAVTMEPIDPAPIALDGLPVERVQADVRDAAAITAALRDRDVVFHLAAKISVSERDAKDVWSVNVDGTRNVVDACLTNDVGRLVHVSSVDALAPKGIQAVDDDTALAVGCSTSTYARSKATGEGIVGEGIARGLDAVIVRPTAIVGPWDVGPSLMGKLLLDVWRGVLPGVVKGGFNFVDVRDVATAMVAAATGDVAGRRYLLGGSWLSLLELAETACRLVGSRAPKIEAPMWLARTAVPVAGALSRLTRRAAKLTHSSLDLVSQKRLVLDAPAHTDLGHRARPIERTLIDTYEWFAECRRAGIVRAPVLSLAS